MPLCIESIEGAENRTVMSDWSLLKSIPHPFIIDHPGSRSLRTPIVGKG